MYIKSFIFIIFRENFSTSQQMQKFTLWWNQLERPKIYDIHHWMIIWSSYRKLVCVGFEPMTMEFHSDALTDWAFRPWVQLALRANLVQLLQFDHLFIKNELYKNRIYRHCGTQTGLPAPELRQPIRSTPNTPVKP